MAKFKAIETADGDTILLNRDFVVMFHPKYGDPKTSGYLSLQNGVHHYPGFEVSKRDGGDIEQWLLSE
ncbi:hypothetical protein [uncultured Pseudomonas sp.]|uniref:hypothetical protein n=1 Tax=uncultured Pseudomonas sp. TaxID=114707 RepID=UPI0025D19364|nr:hypothetical protein [uncultured Pseudomonas sp.]